MVDEEFGAFEADNDDVIICVMDLACNDVLFAVGESGDGLVDVHGVLA